MRQYTADVGLEVHVELATKSKMFCGCAVVDPIASQPNTSVCPICLGMPGVLPVVNQKAVEYAVRTGLALNCSIAEKSIFARKNYFYPDLPKGFQISQYEQPLAFNGWISLQTSRGEKKIRINRAHLEEDTGKLNHYQSENESYSLVDLNRAGIPLLEIVTEPDMHSLEEVSVYSYELRLLLRYLEVTSGDMEKGAMRFEANVSLRPEGSKTMGTRVEIKNLNSIQAMLKAIEYELERQANILSKGKNVNQETLGWNDILEKTYSQRSKEEAHDYRYFPEPDLPPLIIERAFIKEIKDSLPELPGNRRERYQTELSIHPDKVEQLISDKSTADFFDQSLGLSSELSPAELANWIIGDIFNWLNSSGELISEIKISPKDFISLLELQKSGQINKITAKDILAQMLKTGTKASEILEKQDLRQISDPDVIQKQIYKILENYPEERSGYLGGKETLFHWFFGQIMKETGGKANPEIVRKHLKKALDEWKEN